MFQDADGGVVQTLKDWAWAISMVAPVLLLAFVQWLTGYFMTRTEVAKELAALKEAIAKLPTREEVNAFGDRIGREEKLHMGTQDKVADHELRLLETEGEVSELRQYGSEPTREVIRRMGSIDSQLAQINTHLEYLRKQRDRNGL